MWLWGEEEECGAAFPLQSVVEDSSSSLKGHVAVTEEEIIIELSGNIIDCNLMV